AVETGTYQLSVQVRDRANGNPVAGVPVTITLPTADAGQPFFPEAISPTITKTTSYAGLIEVTVASTRAGSFPVEATVLSLETVAGSPTNLVFTTDQVDLTASRLWTEDTGSRYADGESHFVIKAELVDRFGNPVPNTDIAFAASGAGMTSAQTPSSGKTDANGQASIHVAANAAGPVIVTASARSEGMMKKLVTSTGEHQQVRLAFVPGDIDYSASFFTLPTADATKVAGDDANAHLVVAWLYDAHGNPIDLCLDELGEPTTCQFDLLDAIATGLEGDATVSAFRKAGPPELPEMGAAGNQYVATITSKTAGDKTLAPTFDGAALRPATPAADTVTFVADKPSSLTSSFTVTTTASVVADGESTQAVTAQIRDQHGNPIPGLASRLAASATPAVVGTFTAVDGQPGTYSAMITSTVAGSHPVDVTLSILGGPEFNLSADGNADAVFVHGDPDATKSKLVLSHASQTVGQNVTATITLRDAHGNPVPGHSARLWLAPAPQPAFGSDVLTANSDESGIITFTFTSLQAASHEVRADLAETGDQITGSPTPLVFTPGAIASATLTKTSPALELAANGPIAHSAVVTLKDGYGNPIPGATIDFELKNLAAATMYPADGVVVTDASGEARIEVSSSTVGKATLSATIRSSATATDPGSVQFTWTNTPEAEVVFDLTTGTKTVGDNVNPHWITVTVTDMNSVPVADIEDELAAQAGDATIGEWDPIIPGVYKAAITATTAGIKDLQVAYGANVGTPQVAGRDSVEFIAAAPSLAKSRVQVSEGTQIANGTDTHTVTVDLIDAWNNPVLDATLAKPTMTPETTGLTVTAFETDASTPGRYVAKVSTTTAGALTASVTVPGVGEIPAHGLNQVALFVAGAPS
ncbi:MAG: Ig-like domain-containing protein, partial [Micrococcales bacterium]|nr:Ig-like domain-containing protein [Micrococcales bacterium]